MGLLGNAKDPVVNSNDEIGFEGSESLDEGEEFV